MAARGLEYLELDEDELEKVEKILHPTPIFDKDLPAFKKHSPKLKSLKKD